MQPQNGGAADGLALSVRGPRDSLPGHPTVVVSLKSTATGSEELIAEFLPDWDC
jgi:hypothetical protein